MDMDTLPVMIRIFHEIGPKLSYFNVFDDNHNEAENERRFDWCLSASWLYATMWDKNEGLV